MANYIRQIFYVLLIISALPTMVLSKEASGPATDEPRPAKESIWVLPDTGQIHCFDNSRRIPCPGPGESFFGQDANYLINPPDYSVERIEGKYLVVDRVTGLVWQNANCKASIWSKAVDCAQAIGGNGSDTGHWRLPTARELETLANYGADPGIVFAVFNAAGDPHDCFWSITTMEYPSIDALGFCSEKIVIRLFDKYAKLKVLAVRGQTLDFGDLVDSGNGTVTDTATGLTFQAGEALAMTWKEALRYCEKLELGGHADWRLPNIRELLSIVRYGSIAPMIDTRFFPGARPEAYWSSTTYEKAPNMAWVVDFSTGLPYRGGFKKRRLLVRAVRGGHVRRKQGAYGQGSTGK